MGYAKFVDGITGVRSADRGRSSLDARETLQSHFFSSGAVALGAVAGAVAPELPLVPSWLG